MQEFQRNRFRTACWRRGWRRDEPKQFFFFALLILVFVLPFSRPAQAAACRQALALGLDVSGSVDADEYRLQLDGLAAALTSPEVVSALIADAASPVRITVYEWSGPDHQMPILAWTTLETEADILFAAALLRAHQRPSNMPVTTALGEAVRHGLRLLSTQDECWRKVLDISGDGASNTGPRPQDLLISNLDSDVTVNALVIGADQRAEANGPMAKTVDDLHGYFRSYVIRGPGAFVETAQGFHDYEAAMRRKLLRELQSLAIGWAAPIEPGRIR